jgi:phage tail sheath gpL-like
MKVLKNMEIVFTVAAALACAAAYVSVSQPQAHAAADTALLAPAASADGAAPMQVVVIRGKRMSAQEKAESLQEERKEALLAVNESKA